MNSVLYSIFISLLLRMSIITSFILIIKAAFRHKLSASLHSAVWIILCAQFLFCVFNIRIQADTSIYNYIPDAPAAAEQIAGQAGGGFDIRNTIAFAWFFISAAMLLWYVSVFIRHRLRIRSLPLVTDAEALKILADLKAELDIHSVITLRRGEAAQTTGATVIIPDGFCGAELKQILLHELCHYKNRDCLKLWISIVIISFNWFNPLIWYAFRVFRTDIEMLCDDRVIKLTDSRKCYATALVHSSMAKSRFIPGTTSLHNGKREVTQRVKRLVTWKKKKPIWAIIAACVCVGVSCICLTDAVTVAVENNVDIVETPKPVKSVSDVIPVPAPAVTEAPVYTGGADTAIDYTPESADTGAAAPAPENGQGYSESASYEAAPPSTPSADNTPLVGIGSSREDVYGAMGKPETSAQNGTKDTYALDDGSTAVLQYEKGGTVEYAYIVEPSDSGEHPLHEGGGDYSGGVIEDGTNAGDYDGGSLEGETDAGDYESGDSGRFEGETDAGSYAGGYVKTGGDAADEAAE